MAPPGSPFSPSSVPPWASVFLRLTWVLCWCHSGWCHNGWELLGSAGIYTGTCLFGTAEHRVCWMCVCVDACVCVCVCVACMHNRLEDYLQGDIINVCLCDGWHHWLIGDKVSDSQNVMVQVQIVHHSGSHGVTVLFHHQPHLLFWHVWWPGEITIKLQQQEKCNRIQQPRKVWSKFKTVTAGEIWQNSAARKNTIWLLQLEKF